MPARLRFMLLQVRNVGDPIRKQEVRCFCRALPAEPEQITVVDLLQQCPTPAELGAVDAVLIGGSGEYSIPRPGPWVAPVLDTMRELHARAKPTFAACWGFQAMARAFGGTVITDSAQGELGAHPVDLTPAGRADPVFSVLPEPVLVLMGHLDVVDTLPADAVRLATSRQCENQAFTFPGRPIYCTQFHAELDRAAFVERLARYPHYAERLDGRPIAEIAASILDTPDAARLLPRFLEVVFGQRP